MGSDNQGSTEQPRLKSLYDDNISQSMASEFGYKNRHQVPRLQKITLNMGLGGAAVANPNVIKTALEEMALIAGQRPVATKARKSIANFKLREGMPIGCMVTLRGRRMWEFLERLVSVAIPRVRDFRGLSGKAFDGRGNYNFGIREQLMFPEIDYDKVEQTRGFNVTITTTAKTDAECKSLLKHLGMPLRN